MTRSSISGADSVPATSSGRRYEQLAIFDAADQLVEREGGAYGLPATFRRPGWGLLHGILAGEQSMDGRARRSVLARILPHASRRDPGRDL
ncbi:hypothetical protein [Streptomyces sp. NPDC091209]|uniref:hypothetical protein n=1 Tax=Streptomyces sp. NPDC091209 TaxID=3365974 RepID=UPI00382644D1